ncbi:MAG: FHA domain-containing protein [Pseudoclavibacter sp.]
MPTPQQATPQQVAPQTPGRAWVASRAPTGLGQPLPPFPRLTPAAAAPAPAPQAGIPNGERQHPDHSHSSAQPSGAGAGASPNASLPDWSLVLADGVAVPLYGPVIVGRNPSGERFPGATLAAVPDTTRTMSKTHARFYLDDGAPMVDDLGSTNGIALFPGGNTQGAMAVEPGAPAEVRSGDIVQLGEYEITVRRN